VDLFGKCIVLAQEDTAVVGLCRLSLRIKASILLCALVKLIKTVRCACIIDYAEKFVKQPS